LIDSFVIQCNAALSPLIIIVVVMVASKEQPKYYEMHLLAGMLPTSL
jgi:hypothetical protein